MIKWSILYPAFLLLIVLSVSNSQRSSTPEASETDQKVDTSVTVGHARQEWIKSEQDLKKAIAKVLRRALPMVMKEVYKKEVSAPCLGALMGFAKALKDVKLWAYQSNSAQQIPYYGSTFNPIPSEVMSICGRHLQFQAPVHCGYIKTACFWINAMNEVNMLKIHLCIYEIAVLQEIDSGATCMLDASGRLPEGFLHGTLSALGNYEECVEIKVNETKLKLQGQYCTLNLLPPMPEWKPFSSAHLTMPEVNNISSSDSLITYLMSIIHNLHVTSVKVGICTPSKCSFDDVNKLVDIIPEQLGLPWRFQISHCEVKRVVEFTHAQMVVLYVIGVIVFIVLTGTIVDKLYSSEEMEKSSLKSTLYHVAKSFSFTANAKKLADFTCPESELSFVYGIIVTVFCWNVMSNTFMYVNYDVASNFVEALRILKHPFYEIALNRIMPLQSLFFLSGFVTAYRVMKSGTQLNVVKFILSKFWRFTPTYALILAVLLLTPTWGSGPSWDSHMNPVYERCKANWWYNVLYINNFLGSDKLCLDHTWIFAVAAQLHVIAVFILLPLTIHPKIGLMVNFVLSIASLASVALTNVYYDLPPNEMSAILHEKDRSFYAEHSYFRVYTHVSLYCAGVFVGYFMAKNRHFKISTKMSAFLWLITGTGILAALLVVHEWRQGYIPSPLLAALYATFSKVAEAAFLSWVTVACMTGHAGGLEDVFGWRPFAFFGRLTFIAYAMHVPIINMVMNFKKSPVFICELEIFYIVMSHVVGTYIVSYALHMFIEAPFISLTDLLSRRCKGRTFNSRVGQDGPMTEKPIKYSEKERITTTKCINTLEKGHY